jgi:hypothetical protein
MNSSLPTKPFRPHKPNILQWLFSHDALKPSALWFKLRLYSCCNDGLRQGMFRKKFRQYRLAVLGGWFRLGKNIRNDWDP